MKILRRAVVCLALLALAACAQVASDQVAYSPYSQPLPPGAIEKNGHQCN